MTKTTLPGRRERKKAATRKAISDAALEMFLDRGFDAVTIKQIADRADVSLATVYAHFPQKEALVYDEDEELRGSLLAAVHDRPTGTSISSALHAWLAELIEEGRQHAAQHAAFQAMIAATPSLQAYERAMWLRNEDALAAAIIDELGLEPGDVTARLYAHFVLEIWSAIDFGGDPRIALDAAFRLLDHGWASVERSAEGSGSETEGTTSG